MWGFLGPGAGFDGTNHVIAWVEMIDDEEAESHYRVLVSRVTPDGTSLDQDGMPDEISDPLKAKRVCL